MLEDLTDELNSFLQKWGCPEHIFAKVAIGENLKASDLEGLPADYMVICDDNLSSLASTLFPPARIISLGSNIVADLKLAEYLIEKFNDRTLIAFGSGTINDLCKYASFKMKRQYFLFPTAASMNGYFSAYASLKVDKLNKSLKAHLPKYVYVDLSVLRNAPERLLYSGLGDLFCSINTHLEWYFTSFLNENGYREELLRHIEYHEDQLLDGLDLQNITGLKWAQLIKLIFYSGLAMTIAGSSSPASASEHLFTHGFDLLYPDVASQLLHGEKVAYFTQLSLKIWGELTRIDDLFLKLDEGRLGLMFNEANKLCFGFVSSEEIQKNYEQKRHKLREIKKFTNIKKTSWHILRSHVISALGNSNYYSRVKILTIVVARLELKLLSNFRVENAIKISPFIRDRLTIADLYVLTACKIENLVQG